MSTESVKKRGRRVAGFAAFAVILVAMISVATQWDRIVDWYRASTISGPWYLVHVFYKDTHRGFRGKLRAETVEFEAAKAWREVSIVASGALVRKLDAKRYNLRVTETHLERLDAKPGEKVEPNLFSYQLDESGELVLEDDRQRLRFRRGERPEGAPDPKVEFDVTYYEFE